MACEARMQRLERFRRNPEVDCISIIPPLVLAIPGALSFFDRGIEPEENSGLLRPDRALLTLNTTVGSFGHGLTHAAGLLFTNHPYTAAETMTGSFALEWNAKRTRGNGHKLPSQRTPGQSSSPTTSTWSWPHPHDIGFSDKSSIVIEATALLLLGIPTECFAFFVLGVLVTAAAFIIGAIIGMCYLTYHRKKR